MSFLLRSSVLVGGAILPFSSLFSHVCFFVAIFVNSSRILVVGSRSQTPSFNEMQISETDLNASWSGDMLIEDDDTVEEMLNDTMVRRKTEYNYW